MKLHLLVSVVVMVLVAIVILAAVYLVQTNTVTAPSNESVTTVTADPPARSANPGCSWERLVGDSIELWGQRCGDVVVAIDETTKAVRLQKTIEGQIINQELLAQVFDLPTGSINDVLPIIAQNKNWDSAEGCTFRVDPLLTTPGKTRYTLQPSGSALVLYEERASLGPILSTCVGYGLGNSGTAYFEVVDTEPNTAVFINAVQENPPFEIASIVLK